MGNRGMREQGEKSIQNSKFKIKELLPSDSSKNCLLFPND
ncbi:hypothetical protein GXM_00549 [Nostoc sphaeroides CCNUC1]|uniref:Uncharacterized protein n=1 Tax=Nostoc sphaeroides CCNUC1 TaxID=2653204 RepID=A0A5P8VS88_9NOSO|nr:hypothetical protein GXM_00549 [Nostoc sphaeroides CCNUC1]